MANYPISTIAIIGAGPGGLVALRALLAEKKFSSIDVFEQRSDVGGIWNHTPKLAPVAVPSIDPYVHEEMVGSYPDCVFPPGMYDQLEANVPKDLMAYPTHPFPDTDPLFPPHAQVLKYIRDYASDIRKNIKFNTRVDSVWKLGDKWNIRAYSISERRYKVQKYDAIIVSSGHYTIPYVPPIPGIVTFAEHYPAAIVHSKNYRRPTDYTGKKVLLVGNYVSGLDIASQLLPYVQKPLIQCIRNPSKTPPCSPLIRVVPEIAALSHHTRSAYFSDGSVEHDIDVILFATGYLYTLSFITPPVLDSPLITSGERVHSLYQHIFYIPDPTLAFVGLATKVIPYPLSQSQAVLISRIWSSRLPKLNPEEMVRWQKAEEVKKGRGRGFQIYGYPGDANYIDELAELCDAAIEGSEGAMDPARWGGRERWTRENFLGIKSEFKKKKEEGSIPKTAEELGWIYPGVYSSNEGDHLDDAIQAEAEGGDI